MSLQSLQIFFTDALTFIIIIFYTLSSLPFSLEIDIGLIKDVIVPEP
tara:strand:- start:26 stop:166 length:141 start_codon:yes stop_codon:yes gene_type:complete